MVDLHRHVVNKDGIERCYNEVLLYWLLKIRPCYTWQCFYLSMGEFSSSLLSVCKVLCVLLMYFHAI